jgi:hypothetical protein
VRSFVWALDRDVKVLGLLGTELSQLDVKLSKVSTSDLLVQLLGQHMNAEGEFLWGGPKSNLGQHLVREGAGHDKGWVAGGTTGNSS